MARANGLIAYVRADTSPPWIWVVRPDGGSDGVVAIIGLGIRAAWVDGDP